MSRSIGEHVYCPEGSLINGRYKVCKEVGCGNFAKVYKCIDVQHPNATPVAVKILKKEYAADAAFEADILKALGAKDSRGHKVVRMLDQFTWSRCPCFVFALRGASLRSRKFGIARGHLSHDDLRAFIKEMLVTLHFLHHDVRMVHTDLKPENILIDDEHLSTTGPGIGSGWTIADFGSASFYNPAKPDSDLISTRPYRAPEVVLGMTWSTKADIFSMGCIFFELFYGARLFEVNEDGEHLGLFEKRIAKLPLSFTRQSKNFRRFFDANGNLASARSVGGYNSARAPAAGVGSRHLSEVVPDASLRDLLTQMLEVEPTRRAAAADLLRHPYVTGAAFAEDRAGTGPLERQMERLSLHPSSSAGMMPPPSAPSSRSSSAVGGAGYGYGSGAGYDKENAAAALAAAKKRMSPAVPTLSGMPSAADRYMAAPASGRAPAPLGTGRSSNAYELPSSRAAAPMMSARDMPPAGKPSAGLNYQQPRYAAGSRW